MPEDTSTTNEATNTTDRAPDSVGDHSVGDHWTADLAEEDVDAVLDAVNAGKPFDHVLIDHVPKRLHDS